MGRAQVSVAMAVAVALALTSLGPTARCESSPPPPPTLGATVSVSASLCEAQGQGQAQGQSQVNGTGPWWLPGDLSILASSGFHLRSGVGGPVRAYTRLRFLVRSGEGKGLLSCTGIQGATVDATGASSVKGVQVAIDPPVRMFRMDTAGWIPSQSADLAVTKSAPAEGDNSRITDRVAALDAEVNPGVLGLVGALERYSPGALGSALGGDTNPLAALGPSPSPSASPSPGSLTPGRRLQDPVSEILGGVAVGIALTALGVVGKATAELADSWYTMDRIENDVADFTGQVKGAQEAFVDISDRTDVVTSALQARNSSILSLERTLNVSRDWMASTSTQVDTLATNLVTMTAGSAARAAREAALDAALDEERVRSSATAAARIAALGDATRNATVALAAYAARKVDDEYAALGMAQASFAASLDSIARANTGVGAAMDRAKRFANTVLTLAPLRRFLTQQLHGLVAAAGVMGFVPFARSGWKATAPGPRAAWAPGSPLRIVPVDTLVHVSVRARVPGDPRAGVVLNETRLTFLCDPLAAPDLFTPSMTTTAFLDTLAGTGGGCVLRGPDAPWGPGSPDNTTLPCICWFRVERQGCVASTPNGTATVVLPPAFATGPDHPRTLTWGGLLGWTPGTGPRSPPPGAPASGRTLNATSPGPAGFTGYTPCTDPPQAGTRVTVVDLIALGALLGDLTCPPVEGVWNGTADADAVIASGWDSSVGAALAQNSTPYLGWYSLPNGARTRVAGWTAVPPKGAGTAGPGTMWTARDAPVCTRDGSEGVAAWKQGVWPTPVGLILGLLGASWPQVYPAMALALEGAFGALVSDVREELNRYTPVPNLGAPGGAPGGAPAIVTSLKLEVPVIRGVWVPVGAAEEVATWVRGTFRVGASGDWQEVDPRQVRVSAPGTNTLPIRPRFMCDLECATGTAQGGVGCPWPLLGKRPPGPGPGIAPRYVCDTPEEVMSVASQATLRAGTMTYLWWAARVDGNGTAVGPPPMANFTQEDWEAKEGTYYDNSNRAGSLEDVVVQLRSAVEAGVTPVATGLSDYVCVTPGPGHWCRTLAANVLFTPDLAGAHAHLVGTALEGCGRAGLLCLIPRNYTMIVSGVVVALGSVTQALVRTCPSLDASRASALGYPRFTFENRGSATLDTWWYSWVPVNASSPDQWLQGVNASVAARVCVPTDVTPGTPLGPGDFVSVNWFTVCATWDVLMWIADTESGDRVACPTKRIVLPVRAWGSSGSGSGSGSSLGSGSGSASSQGSSSGLGLSVVVDFTAPLADDRPAVGAATTTHVLDTVYVSTFQSTVLRNQALDIALASEGLTEVFDRISQLSGATALFAERQAASMAALQSRLADNAAQNAAFLQATENTTQALKALSANVSISSVMFGSIFVEAAAALNDSVAKSLALDRELVAIAQAAGSRNGTRQGNFTAMALAIQQTKAAVDAMVIAAQEQIALLQANKTQASKEGKKKGLSMFKVGNVVWVFVAAGVSFGVGYWIQKSRG